MTVLYVREQGATVRREQEEVRVTLNGKELASSPVRDVEQVVLCGNVQVTTQAVALLMKHDVDVVFLSFAGTFRGRMIKSGSKFARLRHAQLQISGDEKRCLPLAGAMVRAKLSNQRNHLHALAERSGNQVGGRLRRAAQGIDRMRRQSVQAATTDALRGYEGKSGVYYFGGIKDLLDTSWSFNGRKYYPAPDPFNALLSFGYTLLLKDVTAAIQMVGLDPFLGCLHALAYDRPSLALDLMEEFRPLVVDVTVLNLVLSGKIKAGNFTFTSNPKRPVELGSQLIPVVIEAYEKRMDETVMHRPGGSHNKLRRCLELQTRMFSRVVMGRRQQYEGMVL